MYKINSTLGIFNLYLSSKNKTKKNKIKNNNLEFHRCTRISTTKLSPLFQLENYHLNLIKFLKTKALRVLRWRQYLTRRMWTIVQISLEIYCQRLLIRIWNCQSLSLFPSGVFICFYFYLFLYLWLLSYWRLLEILLFFFSSFLATSIVCLWESHSEQ